MKISYLILVLLSFTACAPLVVRQPVVMPLISKQPDGSLKTNGVLINGYATGPAADVAKPLVESFGPWGELAGIIGAAGLATYVRIKNKQELAAHKDDVQTQIDKIAPPTT